MPTMMTVVEITSPSGEFERHEGPVTQQGDIASIFSAAMHKFRTNHPNVPLMVDVNQQGPNISITHYWKT